MWWVLFKNIFSIISNVFIMSEFFRENEFLVSLSESKIFGS